MGPTRDLLFLYDGEHIYATQISHWHPTDKNAGTYPMSAYYMKEDLTTEHYLPNSESEYRRDGMFLRREW